VASKKQLKKVKREKAVKVNNYTKSILTESVWQTLNEDTRKYLREWDEVVELIETNKYLFEAELTSQQINTLFTSAEEYAINSGEFQTGLGKAGNAAASAGAAVAGTVKVGADIVRQVNKKINELGRMIQDTTPVKNIDAAFEKAKKDMYDKLGGKDSKVNQIVLKLSDAAKAHPGAAKFAVGLLTAAASIAAGPAGGAAAGFLLRMGNDLLAGEKLSTAVGKSAKTAVAGFLAGKAVDGIKDFFGGDVNAMAAAADDPEQLAQVAQKVGVDPSRVNDIGAQLRAEAAQARELAAQMGIEDTSSLNFASQGGVPTEINGIAVPKELLNPEQLGNMDAAQQAADAMAGGAGNAAASAASAAADTFSQYNIPMDKLQDLVSQGLTGEREIRQAASALAREVAGSNIGIEADVTDVIRHAIRYPQVLNQSVAYDNTTAIYETIYVKYLAGLALTESERHIVNELGWDSVKNFAKKGWEQGLGKDIRAAGGALKKGAAAVAKGAKAVGKELGQQITARKLNQMWSKAGKPTDAASVFGVLQSAGLDDTGMQSVAQQANIEFEKPASAAKPDQDGGTSGDGGSAEVDGAPGA